MRMNEWESIKYLANHSVNRDYQSTRMQAPCLAVSADPGLLKESQLGSSGHTSQGAVGSEGH